MTGPSGRLEGATSEKLSQQLDDLANMPAWRRIELLGKAIFGEVWHAQVALENEWKRCAVKAMPKEKVHAERRFLESAANELVAELVMAELQSWPEYTAQALLVAQDEVNFYLVSEYCEQGNLWMFMKQWKQLRRPGSKDFIRKVGYQLLRALRSWHEAGIAHRDISLENVMMKDGEVRLIDFGQAIVVHAPGDAEHEEPVPPSPLGLPGKDYYRAPEADADVTEPYSAKKLDIFAVGVLMYTLAIGRYPFEPDTKGSLFPPEDADSSCCKQLLDRIREHRAMDRVTSLGGLLDIVQKLMAPSPSLRPTAAEALAHPFFQHAAEIN